MQATVGFDHLQTGTQPQMKGVTQNDLRVDVIQHVRIHALDRAIRANRHENRRLHFAMVQGHCAATGFAAGGV